MVRRDPETFQTLSQFLVFSLRGTNNFQNVGWLILIKMCHSFGSNMKTLKFKVFSVPSAKH